MDRRPLAVFFVLCLGVFLSTSLGFPSEALPIGDTLTVIQRPLINIPSIVRVGDTLTVDCDAAPGTSGWAADLVRNGQEIPLTVLGSAYDASTTWWKIQALVPPVPVYELYDLAVAANGGIEDTTWDAVSVISQFKDDYYFIHVTDPHLPTHLFYYESGADTDSSAIVDLREVIRDVNIINPEFVLLTGDLVNEGELEEFLNKQYYTRSQAMLREFDVPVFLTSGNHDLGGWDDTPPPDGNARRNWWRFFGWKRCDNPPAGAPWYTQNYSFDYGPVHYIGLEAYINYDEWRRNIYGDESFTSGQMQWLEDEIAAHSSSAAQVLFYHYDFSNQINLSGLGVDMALWGHTHTDTDDYTHPFDVGTDNTCDGDRSYRLVRVSGGTLQPMPTISAGRRGRNLDVTYSPANDGTHETVAADITNNFDQRFENGLLKFLMPNEPGTFEVTGGTLLQSDDSGPYAVCYVGVDIQQSSSQTVTVAFTAGDTQPPVVAVLSPNGSETWDIGTSYDIAWTATDNTGVTSVDILLSTDGGVTYPATIASGEANDGTYPWLVDAAATTLARIKIVAHDAADNSGEDAGDADFTIYDPSAGTVRPPEVPLQPVISAVTPNPMSGRTVVRFGIPVAGRVGIALYDVSGRQVAVIAATSFPPGYHEVVWENEGPIDAGLYFLRLTFGSAEATCKVVVAK